MVALLEIDRGSRLRLDCLVFASLSLSRVFVPAIRCVWRRHVDFFEQEKKAGHNSFICHWRAFERLKSTIMVITILTTSSRGTPVVSHTEIARMWDFTISFLCIGGIIISHVGVASNDNLSTAQIPLNERLRLTFRIVMRSVNWLFIPRGHVRISGLWL